MNKASAHNAKFIRAAIVNMRMKLLDWSDNSSDLNSIEDVWSLLKEQINKLRSKSYTWKQIKKAIQKKWDSLKSMNINVRIMSKWVNQRKSELNSAWSLEIAITEY